MLKFGIITEAKPEKGTYRVKFPDDGLVSSFLPVLNLNTLRTKTEAPLSVNEHVAVQMDDNCEYGVILGAIYSTADEPANNAGKDIFRTTYEDGSVISFDKSKGEYTIDVKGDVIIKTVTGKKVKITADVEVTGKITATGDVVGAHVSLQQHQHPYLNITTPATTSSPNPGA